MMTLPSSSQLINVIRAELASTLKDVSADPKIANCLGMADSMLASIAVRCEHEIGWMIEEIGEIEAVAASLVASGHDRDGQLQAGRDRLAAAGLQTFDIAAVRARYHQAAELLSGCVEIALSVGGELRTQVESVLSTRLAHEEQIRGALTLVGRG